MSKPAPRTFQPTLGQVFAASLLGLAVLLALLFALVFQSSRAVLLESSERLRSGASREIGERVTRFLARAPEAAEQFQLAVNRGLIDPRAPAAVEPALLAPLLANREVGEITLTYGTSEGFAADGRLRLAPAGRGQWSVLRTAAADGSDRFRSRHVYESAGEFVADGREFARAAPFATLPVQRESGGPLPDPTAHLTFVTPSSQAFYGELLPSDLHYSQLDSGLPEDRRRVEVSVQQVVTDVEGRFVGVLRVGLLARQLSRAVQLSFAQGSGADPHQVFLCDAEGGLIALPAGAAPLIETARGDLRIAPGAIPPLLALALADPGRQALDGERTVVSGTLRAGGTDYLTTFRALPGTRDWVVGIVVPRAWYLGKLTAIRERLLAAALGLMALLILAGTLVLRAVRRAQARILAESLRMKALNFSPSPADAPFRDVREVLEGLEQAKSALRTMGKYVSLDLVRRLYREQREPVLGGEEREVSLMFTDIKNFTAFAESVPPDELAEALGLYLAAFAPIIQQETRGTIDKYIGDAIMAFWNAPEPVPEHARMACEAALRCRAAERDLATTFETRFGLHCATALVGHFGAPDRLNYTALGDAVNLASRLEGLNKYYGTAIIASAAIVAAAGEHFVFRWLDEVAVKGKSEPIRIYELLGRPPGARPAAADDYEQALGAWREGRFAAAIALLERHPGDPPARTLLVRCRELSLAPPPAGWDGIRRLS